MRKCKAAYKCITVSAVCFGAGILLSFFLPQGLLIILEAAVICAVGIFSIL